MANNASNSKRLQIDKANSTVVAVVAISAFIIVFCLVASRALLGQRSYQAQVIGQKEKALRQLKENNQASTALVSSYQEFVGRETNIIGGNSTGESERDGDNAKIILDALPSKYDFPALASSLEKLLSENNYTINSISGTDDEINQQQEGSATPEAVPMPFEFNVTGNYDSIQKLIIYLEESIRPFPLSRLSLEGSNDNLTIELNGNTYYQPARTLDIRKEQVK